MTEAEQLHDEAMRHAQDAYLTQNSGDEKAALVCFRRAFEAERQAAQAYVAQTNAEPTRSVLLRSAASLAMECDEPREAERLAAEGLLGSPPPAIASELRELMAGAYSMQEDLLVGRGAADLAAICLVGDLDNAALVLVWLGELLDHWSEATVGHGDLQLTVQRLNELRAFVGSEFATTWIDGRSAVRGFDDFRQRLRHVEATLADCVRQRDTLGKAADAKDVRSAGEPSGKLTASWEELSRATRELHRRVFPADWLPGSEISGSRTTWPISLPEGSRLVRLAGVLRRLPVAQRRQVRASLVALGMEAGELHEFDTYTDLFLWDTDPDFFLPSVDPNARRGAQAIDEAFLEKVVMVEMRRGYTVANRPDAERHAEAGAASLLLTAKIGRTTDPCTLAANYANLLAKHLEEDHLTQRIVWRICARILAEAGLAMEPSPAAIRTLFQTARKKSLPAVANWLRREQSLAGPRTDAEPGNTSPRPKPSPRERRKN
jgi:hypothetical protein